MGNWMRPWSGFDADLERPLRPALFRGLALLGTAEVALARQDLAAARATWERVAADAGLPGLHRDTARRRMEEAQRLRQGLPGRDPSAYRVQLPALPEPAVVLHVAPAETERADGSEAQPFGSLEKARDAVRAWKKTHGGTLPKGGVRIVIGAGAYRVERTIRLTSEDSGTAEAPVVYQAESGRTPVLGGGARITGWKPISDRGPARQARSVGAGPGPGGRSQGAGRNELGRCDGSAPAARIVRGRPAPDARPLAERGLCQDGRGPRQGHVQSLEHDRGVPGWEVPVRRGPAEPLAG